MLTGCNLYDVIETLSRPVNPESFPQSPGAVKAQTAQRKGRP